MKLFFISIYAIQLTMIDERKFECSKCTIMNFFFKELTVIESLADCHQIFGYKTDIGTAKHAKPKFAAILCGASS